MRGHAVTPCAIKLFVRAAGRAPGAHIQQQVRGAEYYLDSRHSSERFMIISGGKLGGAASAQVCSSVVPCSNQPTFPPLDILPQTDDDDPPPLPERTPESFIVASESGKCI